MLRDLLLRLRSLVDRRSVEGELTDELDHHFERLVESHCLHGLTREAAVRRAKLEFGGFDQVREAHRDARGTVAVEALARDIGFAFLQMRRSPGVSLLAIVCLGLGIGVTTAVFGIVNAVLLRPMAVLAPERLVSIQRSQGEPFSYSDYEAFRGGSQALTGVAATVPMESELVVGGDADIAVAEVVSGSYGNVVGVPLALGRWFTRDDEGSAVISDAVWDRRFHRTPDVIGRTIASESQQYTIVGVVAPSFGGAFAPARTDLWVPVRTRPALWTRLTDDTPFGMLLLFGRLRPGATATDASAELSVLDSRVRGATLAPHRLSPTVADQVRGQPTRGGLTLSTRVMSLLGLVVGVVLLIACANVSHLLLARGALRRREFAMRRALGATRARLVQQLVVEAVLLALGGALAGIVFAAWTNRVLQASFPASFSVFALHVDISLDWRALVFASLAAVLAAVASGLVPALRSSDVRPDEAFKGHVQARSVRGRPYGVVAQAAMSLVLLFVAAGFLQGVKHLQGTSPGFEVAGRLYAHTALPAVSTDRDSRRQFYAHALDRLNALPGVSSAALTSVLPLLPSGRDCVSPRPGTSLDTTASDVGPGYFETLGIALVDGQEFTQPSLARQPPSVIVNDTLAHLAWPGEAAIGKQVAVGCQSVQQAVVVGVVQDSAIRRVAERPRPHVYKQLMREAGGSFTTIVLATRGDASEMVQPVRDVLVGLGQGLRVYDVQPLSVPVEESYAAPKWLSRVLTAFSALALMLAAVGLFALVAYRISRRTPEIGVRMALGARRSDVFREVVADGLRPVVVGIVLGEVVTVGLSGLIASVVEGLAAPGLFIHIAVGAIWIVVAMCACCLPAAWAARVDPIVALRSE